MAEKPKAPTVDAAADKAWADKFANAVGEAGADGGKAYDERVESRYKHFQDMQGKEKPFPQPALNADGTLVNPNAGPDDDATPALDKPTKKKTKAAPKAKVKAKPAAKPKKKK